MDQRSIITSITSKTFWVMCGKHMDNNDKKKLKIEAI
jgi:hypothetical protein